MNSTNSSGNSFTTPQSSPEATEADLRSLEYALGNFKHSLLDTVQTFDTFNEHFLQFSIQDDDVSQQLMLTSAAPHDQVSEHSLQTHLVATSLQQTTPQLDYIREVRHNLHRLPTYPKRRATTTSLTSSTLLPGSSQGSDSLFESSNSSFDNEQPDFPGFESTVGISNLPFLDQLNSLATMAAPTEGTLEPAVEEEEPSEGWKRFQKYAKITLESLQGDLKLLTKQLQDPSVNQSVAQINTHVFKTNRFRTKLASLEDELKGAMYEETYPQDQAKQIKNAITTSYFDVDTQQAVIEDSLEQAREKAKEKDAMAAALRQVANTPTVELPKFDGKTIDYKAFKTNFQFVIQKVNGPQELWATHLVNSLQGPVKQYIGSENKWFNRYEDLWDMLDSKYDNDWTLYYETISAFFYNVLKSEEPEPFKNFFYAQLDHISSIESLNLTVGELLTTYLIESFPTFYKTQMKEALRALQPNKRKATFSPAEVRKVFNDTIGATYDESTIQNKNLPAFLSHYGQNQRRHRRGRGSGHWSNRPTPQSTPPSAPTQPAAPTPTAPIPSATPAPQPAQPLPQAGNPMQPQGTVPQPQTPQHYHQNGYPGNNPPYPQNSYRGSYQGYRGGRGRGAYRGNRGGYGSNSRQRYCFICQDDSKYEHWSKDCPSFTSPAARRERLTAIGRCNCCTRHIHPGECNMQDCPEHPGEKHWKYLCGGQPHPGKNA